MSNRDTRKEKSLSLWSRIRNDNHIAGTSPLVYRGVAGSRAPQVTRQLAEMYQWPSFRKEAIESWRM